MINQNQVIRERNIDMQNVTPQRFFGITRALSVLLGLGLRKARMSPFMDELRPKRTLTIVE